MSASPSLLETKAVIDEFGELDRRVREFRPTLERHKALRSTIEGWYADHPADYPLVAHGRLYSVQLSAKEWKRTITDNGKCLHLLKKACGGVGKLLELLTIPLKIVDQYIPAEKQALILKKERTGPREVTAVAKAAPQVAA